MTLPQKDAVLAEKFLQDRNFEGILELVESDLYKLRKNSTEDDDNKELDWIELQKELVSYLSFLVIPDNLDYDY